MSVTTGDILNAYDSFQGDDAGVFTAQWDAILSGGDKPCPSMTDGVHSTYYRGGASCDYCGAKNR